MGMTDKEREAIKKAAEKLHYFDESMRQFADSVRFAMEAFHRVSQRALEEARGEQDKEVEAFSAQLDNMTDTQIWRQLRD